MLEDSERHVASITPTIVPIVELGLLPDSILVHGSGAGGRKRKKGAPGDGEIGKEEDSDSVSSGLEDEEDVVCPGGEEAEPFLEVLADLYSAPGPVLSGSSGSGAVAPPVAVPPSTMEVPPSISSSSGSGAVPPPPLPPPLAPPRAAGRRGAPELEVAVPVGFIRSYSKDKSNTLVAQCVHPGHKNCFLTRMRRGRPRSDPPIGGRPVGAMLVWLQRAHRFGNPTEHNRDEIVLYPHKDRLQAREQLLKDKPREALLLYCEEREQDDKEATVEPEFVP